MRSFLKRGMFLIFLAITIFLGNGIGASKTTDAMQFLQPQCLKSGIEYQDRDNWKAELINKALNTTYSIWNQNITLTDGTYENDQPYYQKVQYIRSDQYPIMGKVSTDGVLKNTVVGVLIYTGGGSGIFVHIAAATVDNDTVMGNQAFPIGDRADVREVQIQNGDIIVNYRERLSNEIKTKVLAVNNNSLEEVK